MDIVSQIYNSLYKGRDDSSKSVSASQASRAVKGMEGKSISMAALNPGDIFSGEVMDVKNQDVTIRLYDGSKMNARLGEQVSVNIGDELQFMVKESSVEQLLLKVMPNQEQSQMSAIAERALTASGLSLSEKNGNIAMALMEAGEPLDKTNIMRLMQQSYSFPEAKLSTLVTMNKLGLPVTEGNLNQFENYLNETHQLTNTISGMADHAVSIFSDLALEGDMSALIASNDQLLEVIGNGISYEAQDGIEEFRQQMETVLETEEAVQKDAVKMQAEGTLDEISGDHAMPVPVNAHLSLTDSQMSDLLKTLTKAGYPQEQSMELIQNAQSPENLLQQLSDIAMKLDDTGMRSILQTEGYQKLINDSLKSAWSLHPDKMKDPKEIDRLYEKIIEDTQKLSLALEGKDAGSRDFGSQSGQMQEQMRFIQDLNQNFIYAQMPVKLSDQVTNSELYVYADKKKLSQKKDGVSVLFHLDMEHLGPTDVYVSLTGKNVHAVFTLQDHKSIRIVASNMSELADKLSKKGLSLSHEVKKKPEVLKNPVVKEIIDPDAEKSVKRYNFDVRM